MYPVYLIICTHPDYGIHVMPYVGVVLKKGKTVEDRFKQHLASKRNTYLHKAIRKHGKEYFQFEQIDAGNTPEQALELEKWWIARLKTKAPEGGYNLTDGGQGTAGYKRPDVEQMRNRQLGKKASAKTRQQMSAAHGNHSDDCMCASCRSERGDTSFVSPPPSFLGRCHDEETKAKISAAHKGRVFSEESRHRMSVAAKLRDRNRTRKQGRYTDEQ